MIAPSGRAIATEQIELAGSVGHLIPKSREIRSLSVLL